MSPAAELEDGKAVSMEGDWSVEGLIALANRPLFVTPHETLRMRGVQKRTDSSRVVADCKVCNHMKASPPLPF